MIAATSGDPSDVRLAPSAECALPGWAARRVVTIHPGAALAYVESEWRDSIVVVADGEVVLQGSLDGALWLTRGDMFWFDGIGVRLIHNHGAGPAVLHAVSRGSGGTAGLRVETEEEPR